MPPSASGRVERTVPSVRRQSGVVKTSSVGMFGTCAMPVGGLDRRRPIQRAPGSSPTVRSVPGPAKWSASKRELVELARSAARSCVDVLAPRRDRVGLVEAHRARDRLPEPLDVGLAEHLLAQPAFGNAAIVQLTARSFWIASVRLDHLDRSRLPDAILVEVGEQLGLGLARDHDQRAAVERLGPLDEPGGVSVERVVRARARSSRGGRAGRCSGRRRSAAPAL